MLDRLKQFAFLLRLDKPIGTLLLLWPTLVALWLASNGRPDNYILFIFVAGVFLMRSAGCVINDFADRHIDVHVSRTKQRPLATGKITSGVALLIFVILSLLAFVLVLQTNTITISLSFVALSLTMFYPFSKRFIHAPQIILGLAFGMGIFMAYTAQEKPITVTTILLYIANILWVISYDTIYAMVDKEDDVKIGVKSTAILFGSYDRLIVGILQALFVVLLIFVGYIEKLTILYYGSLILIVMNFIWQQSLIYTKDVKSCFEAFLYNNQVGLWWFLAVYLSYSIFSTYFSG